MLSDAKKGESKFCMETLLDSLVVLYDECVNSSLRREKTISNFIEFCKNSFLYSN